MAVNTVNNSDSDDWTLVSAPNSSSPPIGNDGENTEVIDSESSNSSISNNSADHSEEMSEIELGDSDGLLKSLGHRSTELVDNSAITNIDPEVPGFEPIATEEDGSGKSSRRSSSSEFGDYVDLGKRKSSNVIPEEEKDVQQTLSPKRQSPQELCLTSLKFKTDDISRLRRRVERRRRTPWSRTNSNRRVSPIRIPDREQRLSAGFLAFAFIIGLFVIASLYPKGKNSSTKPRAKYTKYYASQSSNDASFNEPISYIPSQYTELEALNSELSQCIKRQSPSSYKYYMSKDRLKYPDSFKSLSSSDHKPYKGLVCYGQEMEWRKRLEQLKSDLDLDLPNLMYQAKKRLTNDMLGQYHPAFKFNLILNQIEYLDYLDAKRKTRQSEETIKHLKSENFQLLRRLNKMPNETNDRRLNQLELEDSKLRRENEALKASLFEKAGPLYIKQSIRLEQVERENIMLKQFHYQVSQIVTKTLKQRFDYHTVDSTDSLDDIEILKSHLSLTSGYLRNLNEKLGFLLEENDDLKNQLRDVHLLNSKNQETNLPMLADLDPTDDTSFTRTENSSKALMSNSCMKSLVELRKKYSHLEDELTKLRHECANRSVALEQSASDHHLNRTLSFSEQVSKALGALPELTTALDKRLSGLVPIDQKGVIEKLSGIWNSLSTELDSEMFSLEDLHFLRTFQLESTLGASLNSVVKILPNYIREAVKQTKLDTKNKDTRDDNSASSGSEFGFLPRKPEKLHNNQALDDPQDNLVDNSRNRKEEKNSSDEVTFPDAHSTSKPLDIAEVDINSWWFFRRAKQRKQLRRQPKSATEKKHFNNKYESLEKRFRHKTKILKEFHDEALKFPRNKFTKDSRLKDNSVDSSGNSERVKYVNFPQRKFKNKDVRFNHDEL